MEAEALQGLAGRFDRLTLRERVLATAAVTAVLVMTLNGLLLQRLDLRRKSLEGELASLQGSMASAANTVEALNASDATSVALAQAQALQKDLRDVNARLASQAAGMIPPEKMADAIHDMLAQHSGVTLIGMRNLPARPVYAPKEASAADSGPYVHPVELILEGSYLDVLAYLRTLEGLRWHFYWRVLDLHATTYPTNRVRLELGTVSMGREWIGL
ncbi:MAG TPA: hypothetical protein VGM84_24955 [Steroidobacteraceae bacterium]|jgi:MSHA biogenesis protein MshJ